VHKHGLAAVGKGRISGVLGTKHYQVTTPDGRKTVYSRRQLKSTGIIRNEESKEDEYEYDSPKEAEDADVPASGPETTSEMSMPPLVPLTKPRPALIRRAGDIMQLHVNTCFPELGIVEDNFPKSVFKFIGCEKDKVVSKVCTVDPYGIVRESNEVRLLPVGTEAMRLMLRADTNQLSRPALKVFRNEFGIPLPPRMC
jgi:hypothetical protein